MKNRSLYSLIFSLFFSVYAYTDTKITTLFFDIETIFTTSDMKASGYVGKINAIRYTANTGHFPSQQDLFKQLSEIPAISQQTTYNKNLALPLILSDWLSKKQPASTIKRIIQEYLKNKRQSDVTHDSMSDIERTVLYAVISMMLTPHDLADIQKVRSGMQDLLKDLKRHGYKIYIVGNWADIQPMKIAFPEIFNTINGTLTSGELHYIKPEAEYYQKVLSMAHTQPEQALWIDAEDKFYSAVRKLGYKAVHFNENIKTFIQSLRSFNIVVR